MPDGAMPVQPTARRTFKSEVAWVCSCSVGRAVAIGEYVGATARCRGAANGMGMIQHQQPCAHGGMRGFPAPPNGKHRTQTQPHPAPHALPCRCTAARQLTNVQLRGADAGNAGSQRGAVAAAAGRGRRGLAAGAGGRRGCGAWAPARGKHSCWAPEEQADGGGSQQQGGQPWSHGWGWQEAPEALQEDRSMRSCPQRPEGAEEWHGGSRMAHA